MSISDFIKNILRDPEARGLDLDSDEATRAHAKMIQKKKFLNKLYRHYYKELICADFTSPPGLRLEIGAGGGFLKELIPSLVTLDIRPGAKVDICASALSMPIKDSAVGSIFVLNTLHHLPNIRVFFKELRRVLAPGGRAVFIEPWVSPFSRIIYKNLHHEPFLPDAVSWDLITKSAMSASNIALPWIIFERDKNQFESEFPDLAVLRVAPHTILLYLLSGGVSMRPLAPGCLFDAAKSSEWLAKPLMKSLGTMMTIELMRR